MDRFETLGAFDGIFAPKDPAAAVGNPKAAATTHAAVARRAR